MVIDFKILSDSVPNVIELSIHFVLKGQEQEI